jgi:predicted dehydrogenase
MAAGGRVGCPEVAAVTSTVRWGVIATGGIASAFVTDLRLLEGTEVVAVGSRSQDSADRFAAEHSIGRAYPTYASLVSDDEVDVVYVATPHPGHHAAALLAIEAGKAVLVEKPFTMDAAEARSLVAAARARGVFLMEAMWARFVPWAVRLRELLADGTLGEIRQVIADHGQWFPQDASHRLFAPDLGGGALLDLGVYPVSFASMVLGSPAAVTAVSDPAFTGVDATTSILLQYAGGAHAVLTATLTAPGPTTAAVVGTDARVQVDGPFYTPAGFTLTRRDGTSERFDHPVAGRGLRFEAAEVIACLREGRLESDVMPLDETVAIMATLDEVRRQVGLRYPPS